MKNVSGVYAIFRRSTHSGIYIGSSGDLVLGSGRLIQSLIDGECWNSSLQKDFDENGLEEFMIEFLEICQGDLDERKDWWLAEFIKNGWKVYNKNFGVRGPKGRTQRIPKIHQVKE